MPNGRVEWNHSESWNEPAGQRVWTLGFFSWLCNLVSVDYSDSSCLAASMPWQHSARARSHASFGGLMCVSHLTHAYINLISYHIPKPIQTIRLSIFKSNQVCTPPVPLIHHPPPSSPTFTASRAPPVPLPNQLPPLPSVPQTWQLPRQRRPHLLPLLPSPESQHANLAHAHVERGH